MPKEVADVVPRMWRICIVSWAVLCLVACLCVKRNPDREGADVKRTKEELREAQLERVEEGEAHTIGELKPVVTFK